MLYMLLLKMGNPDVVLFIDEPDNYVALAEIQPWLLGLKESIETRGSQALLISHHPELIDNLAPSHGLMFEREKNGPASVRPFEAQTDDECLTASEIVARGWK